VLDFLSTLAPKKSRRGSWTRSCGLLPKDMRRDGLALNPRHHKVLLDRVGALEKENSRLRQELHEERVGSFFRQPSMYSKLPPASPAQDGSV
jgi:hypothetical protein